MSAAPSETARRGETREQGVEVADERSWIERNRGWVFAALATVILLGAFVLIYKAWMRNESSDVLFIEPTAVGGKVYVTGAVLKPGVYPFPAKARVEDALRLAGGAAADADLEHVNLAVLLEDEQQVVVPHKEEVPAPAPGVAAATATAGRVNINAASEAELDTLPGIGPVTAQKIVDYRARNGPFTHIEDLRDLKLVNAATFEKLADRIATQ